VAIFLSDMTFAGGIQRVAAGLTRDFQPWYDTVLLTVEPLKSPAFYEAGLDFRSLNFLRNASSRLRVLYGLFVAGRRLRRFVLQNKIDTVVAIWYDWASVAALLLPRSVKKIGWEHISYSEPTETWQKIRSRTYRYLDAVVSLTETDLPAFEKIASKVQCIPNYVPAIEPDPADARENILLTVGHLISRKGIDRLLLALKQPLLDNPTWKLVVVGGGEKGRADSGYLDSVMTLIQTLQLQGRVEFHSATERIDDWYSRASIYVMGSRMEGLPMVLIEAKAHGLPAVAFDCPTGPREIIRTGVDGFLVDNDSDEFGRSVAKLMNDAGLRRRMGTAAAKDVEERFSPQPILAKWVNLIESLHANKI